MWCNRLRTISLLVVNKTYHAHNADLYTHITIYYEHNTIDSNNDTMCQPYTLHTQSVRPVTVRQCGRVTGNITGRPDRQGYSQSFFSVHHLITETDSVLALCKMSGCRCPTNLDSIAIVNVHATSSPLPHNMHTSFVPSIRL